MYKMLAITAPVSFAAKSLLKYIFGRITTREWLLAPQDLGFHWFNGGDRYTGFPSGHMVVITALVAIVWRFQPRFRSTYLVLLILLALSLVATNYHFLSDVIVGAYVGLLVEVCIFRIVARSWSIRD
jgi:membrane-associated phospholipid phosphatase